MSLFLNPGAGDVTGATLDNAIENMKAFTADVIAAHGYKDAGWVASDPQGHGGRWAFLLTCIRWPPEAPVEQFTVDMPGLPLERVRYLGLPQNPFEFTRLYVNGSSWLWKFAVNACASGEA